MSERRFNLLGPRVPGAPAPEIDATPTAPASLIPAPLPTLLGLVAAAGGLLLLVMAWPLIACVAVVLVEGLAR